MSLICPKKYQGFIEGRGKPEIPPKILLKIKHTINKEHANSRLRLLKCTCKHAKEVIQLLGNSFCVAPFPSLNKKIP